MSTTGTRLLGLTSGLCQRHGQLLTVTRNDATYSTRSVYFLPQPLSRNEIGIYISEAAINAGAGEPHRFVCAGDADVLETDRITYNGFQYRIDNQAPNNESGTTVVLNNYAVRENVGS